MKEWDLWGSTMEYLRDLNLISMLLRVFLSVLIGGILGMVYG